MAPAGPWQEWRNKAIAPYGPTALKLIRAGIDHRPQIGAVSHPFHLGREPAVAVDPFLHRLRIVRHQVGGAGVTDDFEAEGPGLVVISLVEPEARLRSDADAVERHDAEHQRAGGIADSLGDPPVAAVSALGA